MCICRNNQIKTNFMVCLLLGIDLFPVPEDPRCCLCAGGFVSHYCGNFLNRNISIDTLYLPPFHRAGSPDDSWRPHAERYMQQLLSTVQVLFVCDSGKLHLWGFFFFFLPPSWWKCKTNIMAFWKRIMMLDLAIQAASKLHYFAQMIFKKRCYPPEQI